MPMKQLEAFDSGSNYNFGDKMTIAHTPRSMFDLSHLHSRTIPNAGMVIPLGMPIETVPNEDFDISADFLLRVMPQVVPLYSRQRVYIYAFWSRYADLWSDFDVFMRKGYSGNVVKTLPTFSQNVQSASLTTPIGDDSFFGSLGLPIGLTLKGSYDYSQHLHSLWLMQAFRIWRDYFCNKNYYIDDRVVLPDDDSRFRLGSDGKLLSAKDAGIDFEFVNEWSGYIASETTDTGSTTATFGGFFHDWPKDRFTSALPWPQRGDTPTLPINFGISSLTGDIKFPYNGYYNSEGGNRSYADIVVPLVDQIAMTERPGRLYGQSNSSSGTYIVPFFDRSSAQGSSPVSTVRGNGARLFGTHEGITISNVTASQTSISGITLNQLRELAIAQTELEKMARTDGSYSEFGLTFFGESSKAARDYRPLYIGGTYKNIVFSEVLQTSGSSVGTTDSSSTSPLGAYAGHGIAGQQQGYIGHLHSDDYGSIMIMACIMPDVYYSQGIPVEWTRSLQSDFFLPERAKLGMVPILNQEIFASVTNDPNSDQYATNLWAYQNPFDEMRYRPNTISGKIANPVNKSFFPYTQSRKFTNFPYWGKEFATADDVRKDYLFAPSEDAYSAQFSLSIRSVRPLPYKPVPATILN